MLVSKFSDGKSTPEGQAVAMANGAAIKRCRGMMYWLRWKNHTFDIRVMWKLLGIEEQQYFIDTEKDFGDWKENPDFFKEFISGIEGKDFKELLRRHDEELEAAA